MIITMNILSHRLQSIKPSPTLVVTAKAQQLKAEGKDIISLSVGEPDFDTPDHIKAAAMLAIQQGKTKYTAVEGTLELKKAICDKLHRENQLSYSPKQVIVSCGAKHSIFNLLATLINPGDEVIIPAPYWVSYPDIVQVCEGKPVFIETTLEQSFKITPTQLLEAITPRTKMVILNSPSNPTGMAYTRAELAALGEILLAHPAIFIATDDIYEHILWDEAGFHNILNACPALYDRTIVINGVSKSYAMTGWRIGYAAGPAPIIEAMSTLQSQNTSNPCSISQAAAVAALSSDQSCIVPMVEAFKTRHDYLVSALNEIPGFECIPGKGTFYVFARIEKALATLPHLPQNDVAFTEYLLNEALIAGVPGSAFGSPGYIRFSYATSLELLQKAIYNLKRLFCRE